MNTGHGWRRENERLPQGSQCQLLGRAPPHTYLDTVGSTRRRSQCPMPRRLLDALATSLPVSEAAGRAAAVVGTPQRSFPQAPAEARAQDPGAAAEPWEQLVRGDRGAADTGEGAVHPDPQERRLRPVCTEHVLAGVWLPWVPAGPTRAHGSDRGLGGQGAAAQAAAGLGSTKTPWEATYTASGKPVTIPSPHPHTTALCQSPVLSPYPSLRLTAKAT